MARLAGIDVARGCAVLGMYAVHVGPQPSDGGIAVLFEPFEGRSAALFAVLAGVSIALMSGGGAPKAGSDRTRVAIRLATRAPLLVGMGLWLSTLHTGYIMILAFYGACFLFAIPLLRARAKTLAMLTLGVATVVPVVSWLVRALIAPRDLVPMLPDATLDTLTGAGAGAALLALLLTGTFPAVSLMTYLLAGMAIGRLDLGSDVVRWRLFGGGIMLATLSYGASWAATSVLGGMSAIEDALGPAAARAGMTPAEFFEANVNNIHGTPPTTSPAWLLVSTPHSYTPFDFLACAGVAAAVIGACLLLSERFERRLRPLAALGSVILTAYVGHFVAIRLGWPEEPIFDVLNFVLFALAALVIAVVWRRWVGRGPLEWALHVLSNFPVRWYDALRTRKESARLSR